MAEPQTNMDSQTARKTRITCFVCFAERIGGTLAAVTVANLITNISWAKVPCWAAAINLSVISVVMLMLGNVFEIHPTVR